MGRKKDKPVLKEEEAGVEMYEVRNLVESVLAVPVYNENGEVVYLHVRIQGRGGQKPPLIPATSITDAARELEKKRMIRFVKVG